MTLRCSKSIKVQCFAEPTLLVDLSNFSFYISVVSILHHTTEPPKRANFLFGTVEEILRSLLASKGWYLKKYYLVREVAGFLWTVYEPAWAY